VLGRCGGWGWRLAAFNVVVGGGWWVVVSGRGSVFVPVFAPPVFVVVPLFFVFAPHVLYIFVCFAGLCIGGATGT